MNLYRLANGSFVGGGSGGEDADPMFVDTCGAGEKEASLTLC